MRSAIYARYSSDLQDRRSITDQVAAARDRIERDGWTVVEVYSDAAISGTSMHNRPGLLDMMVAAKEGRFDAVVTESLDRLSRDQEDIAGLHKRLSHWGVKIVTLADGVVNKMHVGLKGLISSIYLDDLAQKTRRGQVGRVREGRFPGGRCYGYDNVPGDASKRVINVAQAEVVRRIYREYIEGRSPVQIAGRLNAEGVPAPFGGDWNGSTINGSRKRASGIISNPLYAGRPLWNRQRFVKDPETGRRIAKVNQESDWIEVHTPELAIITEAEFAAARARRQAYAHLQVGHRRRPRHLLSGLVQCGACGGAMIVATRDRLACTNSRNKVTCSNRRTIRVHEIEGRVLAALQAHLLAPDVVAAAVEAYREERRARATLFARRRRQADKDLAAADRRIAGIIAAIEAGGDPRALAQRLNAVEAERRTILADMPPDDGRAVVALHPHAADRYRAKVEAIQAALTSGSAAAQDAIKAARELIDRLVVTPGPVGAPQRIDLVGNLAALVSADFASGPVDVGTIKVVAGGRYAQHSTGAARPPIPFTLVA